MKPEPAEVYNVVFQQGDPLPGRSAFIITIRTSHVLSTTDDETLVGTVMERGLAPRVAELVRLADSTAASPVSTEDKRYSAT